MAEGGTGPPPGGGYRFAIPLMVISKKDPCPDPSIRRLFAELLKDINLLKEHYKKFYSFVKPVTVSMKSGDNVLLMEFIVSSMQDLDDFREKAKRQPSNRVSYVLNYFIESKGYGVIVDLPKDVKFCIHMSEEIYEKVKEAITKDQNKFGLFANNSSRSPDEHTSMTLPTTATYQEVTGLKRTFIIYVPEDEKCQVKVYLWTAHKTYKMIPSICNMYTCDIYKQSRFEYSYRVTYEYPWSFTTIFESDRQFVFKHFKCTEQCVYRDKIWKSQDELIAHFIHITKGYVNHHSIKEICMDIESVCKGTVIEFSISIFVDALKKCMRQNNMPLFVIAIIIGNLASSEYIISQVQVNPNDATTIIEELQRMTLDMFTTSCCEYMPTVCHQLYRMALQDRYSCVSEIKYFSNFLGKRKFRCIDKCIHQNLPMCHSDNSTEAFYNMYKELVMSYMCDNWEESLEYIEKLLKHAPVPSSLQVMKNRQNDELGDEKVLKVTVKGFHGSVERDMCLAIRHYNIAKLCSCWMYFSDYETARQDYKDSFEKHILNILEKTDETSATMCNLLEESCGLFEDDTSQENLINFIAKSRSQTVLELFLKLPFTQKFTNIYKSMSVDVFTTWLDNAKNYCLKDQIRPFQVFLDVLEMTIGRKEVQIKISNHFIATMSNSSAELLSMWKMYEKNLESYPHAEEVFAQHVLCALRSDRKSNPWYLLQNLTEQRSLYVDSRWTAKIVSTLLDEYCTLKSTSSLETDLFNAVMQHIEIWELVVCGKGQHIKSVHSETVCKFAFAFFSNLAQRLLENRLSYDFCKTIMHHNRTGFEVLSYMLCTKYMVPDLLTSLKEVEERYEKQKGKLCSVVSVFSKILDNIKPEILPENFKDIKCTQQENLDKLRYADLSNAGISELWHGTGKLAEYCSKLYTLTKSRVFWNVYKEADQDQSEDLFSVRTYAHTEPFEPDYREVNDFLESLLEVGTGAYIKALDEIENSATLNISKIKVIFKNASSVEAVKKEKILAETFLLKEICEEQFQALQQLAEIGTLTNNIDILKSAAGAFDLLQGDFLHRMQMCDSILNNKECGTLTLKKLQVELRYLFWLKYDISEKTFEILCEIGSSKTLLSFLRKIIDEDIRNLIDAVDDISEQYVQESTVSGLIEVKTFLHPVLIQKFKNADELFSAIGKRENAYGHKADHIPLKINACQENIHQLKALYGNVANRGEQTKETIEKILSKGTFNLCLTENTHVVDVTCSCEKDKSSYVETTLVDLRSRALLLMNSERAKEDKTCSSEHLVKFVQYVDQSLEIKLLLKNLYLAGHTDFETFKMKCNGKDLQSRKLRLEKDLKLWEEHLSKCRKKFFLLNFLQSVQLHTFFQFLKTEERQHQVEMMLNFINPKFPIIKWKQTCKMLSECETSDPLEVLGMSLDLSVDKDCFKPKLINFESKTRRNVGETVQKGKLSIVSLDETSVYVVKTILALYENTTNILPESYQILFCSKDTEWDEVRILLNRCEYSRDYHERDLLYCLANVELLPSEMQLQLVESIRTLSISSQYLLCIVFRGGKNHLFVDEFAEHVTTVQPWSDSTTEGVFREKYPGTLTLSSDIAGLGKTTQVKQLASINQQGAVTVHISGNVLKKVLVHQLNQLNLRPYQALHIDIANVDDVISLDTFLFELLFLRYVTTGIEAFHLTNDNIFLEIANTIHDKLRNSLQTAMCFGRANLIWQNFADFIVSTETNSPVQVVCAYFDALERSELDKKDITFTEKYVPLPSVRCRSLLAQYIQLEDEMSFAVVNSFLKVLADQLKKMSCSSFFKTAHLKDMAGKNEIKSSLTQAVANVSIEFATRSIKSCKARQIHTVSSGQTTNRPPVDRMIRWEDSNHLIYVFHSQNIQTLSAMYRDVSKVPADVKNLFESQMKKHLEDFKNMNQVQLQCVLQKVARTSNLSLPPDHLKSLATEYALTPDNLLKMVLIVMRIRARVPVVVMGETGCGKTSLIRYLANICEVEFDVLNIHAGTELSEIETKLIENNNKAITCLQKERWMFLDEINTSEHVSLMSDVICHHRLAGQQLSPNLVILSACNPYKLRSNEAICTAGLKAKVRTDELSKLVYRVLPLPQQLVDYVWDFGSLSSQDEKLYIRRMTHDLFLDKPDLRETFVDLLTLSQEFIRTTETSYNVSLRDVQRCRILAKWFSNELKFKKAECSKQHDSDLRAVIMAIAHCYYSRLVSHEKRKTLLQKMAEVFKSRNTILQSDDIKEVIIQEQKDILQRMELPLGTAQNQSLQENVFMILVCLLNKIPIFVVGKPGCSKSLAMQVIRSNLRGKDSKNEFFRRLPQIYCVSFQGSESSTSDGIIKVFEKAENYQKSNSEDVLSVVILDEIGLAEVSRFNPLKVLHSLLEPEGKSYPNVAVVGISNWALDASKMNRAIHLSRPDMDSEELFETAKSISQSFEYIEAKKQNMIQETEERFSTANIEYHLWHMAVAYDHYCAHLAFENFHGLRDYYALVKYVAKECTVSNEALSLNKVIQKGLERNFGGLPTERSKLHSAFKETLDTTCFQRPVIDIIEENIKDFAARHLLLITSGHSALGILVQKLVDIGRKRYEVIFGSQFEEDLTDDYNYRILSRIILCMEEGVVLILKDLNTIYGSLYDMLNQNYTVIGKTKNCRVALGHYSNPICRVSDSFRCIVLVDEAKLNFQDPPFLNRFEKQLLCFSDRLTSKQKEVIAHLNDWLIKLGDVGERFKEIDLFPIYNTDLLASLVLKLDTAAVQDVNTAKELIQKCKSELVCVINSDAVLRLSQIKDSEMLTEVEAVRTAYFERQIHGGLWEFYEWDCGHCEENSLRIIFTFTSVHSSALRMLKCDMDIQTEFIGAFKSEKQLSAKIQHFWLQSSASLLCMQCSVKDDGKHVSLVMSIIERFRTEFLEKCPNRSKHVYLILHMRRMMENPVLSAVSHINFLSNWKLATIDSIDRPRVQLPRMCENTLIDTIKSMRPLQNQIKEQLFWSFTRIKYSASGRSIQSIQTVLENIKSCDQLLEIIDKYLWTLISTSDTNLKPDWQVQVALDRHLLSSSSSMVDALETFLQKQIQVPLARIICHLETHGVLESFLIEDIDTCSRRKVWECIFLDPDVFDISVVLQESGPECYECLTPDHSFRTPFFKHMYELVEETKADFLKIILLLKERLGLDDEDVPEDVINDVIRVQQSTVVKSFPKIHPMYSNLSSDYFEDFCNVISRSCVGFTHKNRTRIAQILVLRKVNLNFEDFFEVVMKLHSTVWLNPCLFSTEMQILSIYSEHFQLDLNDTFQTFGQVDGNKSDNPLESTLFKEIKDQLESSLAHGEIYLSKEYGVDSPSPIAVYQGECETSMQTTWEEDIDNERNGNYSKDAKHKEITEGIVEEIAGQKEHELSLTIGSKTNEKDVFLKEFVDSDLSETSTDENEVMSEEGDSVDEPKARTDKDIPSFDLVELVKDKCEEKASETIFSSTTHLIGGTTSGPLNEDSENSACESLDHNDFGNQKGRDMRLDVDLSNGNTFVRDICKNLLPCRTTMKMFKNTLNWSSTTGRILPLVSVVSNEPVELDMLRFCHGIADNLIFPLEIDDNFLFNLADGFHQFGAFFCEQVYRSVLEIIEAANGELTNERQRVIADFMLKGIFNEPSDESLRYLYRLIIHAQLPDSTCSFLKVIIDSAIEHQLMENEQIDLFQHLLQDNDYEDVPGLMPLPFFENMDTCLMELSSQGRNTDPFVVLLVDIFEERYLEHFMEHDPSTHFLTAHNNIQHDSLCVRYIASLGCYKALLKFAMLDCGVKKEYRDVLNTIFTADLETKNQTLPFFNFLRGKLSSNRFLKTVMELKSCLPDLKLQLQPTFAEICLDNSPLIFDNAKLLNPQGTSTEETILKLLEHDITDNNLLNTYHVLLKEFYIPQSFMALNDKQKQRAELLDTEINKHKTLEPFNVKLMGCLLGRTDFKVKQFMHTSESTSRQCLINTILTFLYSILLSNHGEDGLSLFQTCLCEPLRLKEMFLPGLKESQDSGLYYGLCDKNDMVFTSCSCSNRILLKSVHENSACLVCGETLNIEVNHSFFMTSEQRKGWQFSKKMENWDFEQNSMSSVACSLLYFFMKGCLLGSFAIGILDGKGLEDVLDVPEIDIDIPECLNLECHWKNLLQLLNLEDYHLFIFMHSFIYKNQDLLCFNPNAFQSCQDRDKWEELFSRAVQTIIPERFHFMKQLVRKSTDSADANLDDFEACLGEFNELEENNKLALFRMTSEASVENFRAELSCCTAQFPFLSLVIHQESDIKLVLSMYSIIQWHLTVVSATSYLFKRNDIIKMSVHDFVYHEHCINNQSILKKRFEILCSTWNNIYSDQPDKSINWSTRMSDCLILGEHSQLFQCLHFLAGIQNKVIQLAMSMASDCRSLNLFAKSTKGQVVVPEVKVLEINKEMLMKISLSIEETILKESQCDYRYGYGRHVIYNFLKIEKSLVRDVLIGKVFIKVDISIFPKVTFIDELYKNVSLLIQDIRNSITQENLPSDINKNTQDLHEKNPKMVSQLLVHIGMMLPLLRKTTGDSEETVEEYVKKWKNLLTSEFPLDLLPRRNMKLCHIVGLYELLEELNAGLVVNGLGEEFRMQIDIKEKQYFKNMVEKHFAVSEILLKALKKFVHRCLFNRETEHKEGDTKLPLGNYLSDSSFWPIQFLCDGYVVIGEQKLSVNTMIPAAVTVGHIYDVVEVLRDNMQKIRQGSALLDIIMEHKIPPPSLTQEEKVKKGMMKLKRKYLNA